MSRVKKDLKFAGLSSGTLRAYRRALSQFLQFIKQKDVTMIRSSHLDKQLADYLNISFQEGEPMSHSGHLLSALKRFHPELRMKLPRATQYYRNWSKTYQPQRAVPMTWPLVEAMIGFSLCHKQPSVALLLGIGFDCFLRTSEIINVSPDRLILNSRASAVSLVIPTSKTSQGNAQVLQIQDPTLVNLVLHVTSRRAKSKPLWKHSSGRFRKHFERILCRLGFPKAVTCRMACAAVVQRITSWLPSPSTWLSSEAAGVAPRQLVSILTLGLPSWVKLLGLRPNLP